MEDKFIEYREYLKEVMNYRQRINALIIERDDLLNKLDQLYSEVSSLECRLKESSQRW